MFKEQRSLIFAIPFIVYAVLSWLLFMTIAPQQHFEIDSPAYTHPVEMFEKYGSFIAPGVTTMTTWYGVGYPMFMAAIRMVLGHNYNVVFFAQVILGLLLLCLTYRLGRIYFSERVAWFALLFASINLGFLVFAQYILADILLTFLMVLVFERWSSYLLQSTSSKFVLPSALFCLALSLWVKATAFFFLLFLLVGSLLFVRKQILLLVLALVPFFGLCFYNYCHYGYPLSKGVEKVNLYCFFLPKVIAETESVSIEVANKKISSLVHVKEYASGKGWEKVETLLRKKVLAHPFICIKIWITNVIKTILGLYTNQLKLLYNSNIRGGDCSFFKFSGSIWESGMQYLYFGTSSYLMIAVGFIEAAWTLLRLLLVCISLLGILSRRAWMPLFLLLSYGGYFAIITGCDGCARLRMPFEALLIILAIDGFFRLYDYFCKNE